MAASQNTARTDRFTRTLLLSAAGAVGLCAAAEPARAAQVTVSWIGPASSNWNAGANWSGGAVPRNGTPAGTTYFVLIDGGQAQNSTVGLDLSPTIDALTISAGDQLTVNDGRDLTIAIGPVSNAGTFLVGSTTNFTDISNGGASISLTGSGVFKLQNFTRFRGGGTWNNSSTITGFGEFAIGESAIVNTGTIAASGGNLLIDARNVANGMVNSGTLSAVSGAQLRLRGINGGGFTNTNGRIIGDGGIVYLLEGASLNGGTLSVTGSGSVRTLGGQSATLTDVTNAGNYTAEDASNTTWASSMNNTGSFTLASGANSTDLSMSGAVSLSGGGTVNMQNFARIRGGSGQLLNVNNTIRGSGDLGLGELGISNQATGVISADVNGALLQIDPVNGGSLSNAGTLQATGGGVLVLRGINGGTFSNSNVIQALAGSNVRLQESASITGGVLTTVGTGTINVLNGHSAFLTNVTNSGNFSINDSSALGISGTITNSGSININSSANSSDLSLQGGTVTLTGAGSVNMQNSARIGGSGTLVTNNRIHGRGDIGIGQISIVNNATISADQNNGTQSFALNIDPINGGSMLNNGTLQAGLGGTLVLRGINGGTFTNAGRIEALNASNVQLVENASITGGSLTTSGTGTICVLNGHTAFITTLANAGNLAVNDSSTLGVTGTITNSGSININSGANTSFMNLQGGGVVTLAGLGTVNMQNSAVIGGSGTLVNSLGQTIRGAGHIGYGQIKMVNNGLVSADVNGAGLLLDPVNAANSFTNNGTWQATGGGVLVLRGVAGGNFINNAAIFANNASEVRLQESADITGGSFSTSGSGFVRLLNGQAASITDVTNLGDLTISDSANLTINGTITNNGSINIVSTANSTDLINGGGVGTLAGSGVVNMQNFARIRGSGTLVVGATQTIHGTGEIGIGQIAVSNNGLISADLNAGSNSTSLGIDPVNTAGAFTNNGILQATNATLVLNGVAGGNFVNNNIIRATGGNVQLVNSASISGGTLTTSGGGTISVLNGHTAFITTLTNTGNLTVNDNSGLGITGTITNSGSINLASGGNFTDLVLQGGTDTLAGTGAVNMQNFARIRGSGTLVNSAGQTIRGAGEIGIGQIALTNNGLVSADVNAAGLLMDPVNGVNTFINNGTWQATGGGILVLRGVGGGNFINNAAIFAAGASEVRLQEGADITGGSFSTAGTGVVRVQNGYAASITNVTNLGNLTVGDNANLTINGTITNNGSINIASGGNATDLINAGGTGTLTGAGSVNMQSAARIRGSGTLVIGASQTVRGAGEIAIGQIAIRNAGTIDAAGGSLLVDPVNAGTSFINTGTVRASTGSLVLRGVGGGTFDTTGGAVQVNAAGAMGAQEGAVVAAGSISLDGFWNQIGGSLTTATFVRGAGTMNVDGATFRINANGGPGGTSRLGGVPTAANSGKLDLTDNDLVIDYSGASPITTLRQRIQGGYNGGAQNGTGIITSKGPSSPNAGENGKTALGYGEAAALGLSSFSGQTVDNTSLLVKYTYQGDTNLDGQVDVIDLGNLATAWQTAGVWTNGDSNYDGSVDVIDLGLLATNWQAGVGAPLGPGSLDQALAAYGLPSVGVPEPGTVVGAALALAALSRRRRR